MIKNCVKKPFTHICNRSFATGIFSNQLHIANVVRMFKWYDELLFSNYKPVSVLSVFSNVPERLMHHRLITYIYQNRLLYNLHFGFQKGKFTRMALIAVIDKISEALDNGDFVIDVFLNFPRRLIQLITAFFSEIFMYALKWFMLDKFLGIHMDLKI